MTRNDAMIGYHVTSTRNRPTIFTEGLRTDWCGWDAGYIWFFLDFAQAQASQSTGAWGGAKGENDIWAIDLNGLEVVDDPHEGWGYDRTNRAVSHSIEPGRLRLLINT